MMTRSIKRASIIAALVGGLGVGVLVGGGAAYYALTDAPDLTRPATSVIAPTPEPIHTVNPEPVTPPVVTPPVVATAKPEPVRERVAVPVTEPAVPERIEEDEPGWDCTTMGNGNCGPSVPEDTAYCYAFEGMDDGWRCYGEPTGDVIAWSGPWSEADVQWHATYPDGVTP